MLRRIVNSIRAAISGYPLYLFIDARCKKKKQEARRPQSPFVLFLGSYYLASIKRMPLLSGPRSPSRIVIPLKNWIGVKCKTLSLQVFVILLFGSITIVHSCNCVTNLPKISKEQTDAYTVIFSGYIKRLIKQDKEDYAEFVVAKPYKGLIPRDIKISYDALTSCKMPFSEGDQWLIYAKKDTVNKKWLVNYCERSRKFAEGDEEDEYTIFSGITLEEELRFLEINYSSGQVVGEDTLTMIIEEKKIVIDARRDDNYGTPKEKLILLICSLAGMIVIYLIIRKFVK